MSKMRILKVGKIYTRPEDGKIIVDGWHFGRPLDGSTPEPWDIEELAELALLVGEEIR
jgi:hypothetical protein